MVLAAKRLFGSVDLSLDPATRARRAQYRKSILDLVRDDTRKLVRTLGPADRRKIDEYLTAVREIEKRIQGAESENRDGRRAAAGPAIEKPAGIPIHFLEYVKLMYDLLALAFQTDQTRIATMMVGREGSMRVYPEIGIPDPHHPFSPPEGYADLYSPEEVELPLGFWQDHVKSPPHIRHMVANRGVPNEDPTMTFAADEEQFRRAAAAQYGLITLMDEQIGRVLAALEENGLAEDTIVVFTSDHGDLFGDHGLMLKHFSHYRAVTNVPLTGALVS